MTSFPRTLAILLFAFSFLPIGGLAQDGDAVDLALLPAEWTSDFEKGHIDAWFSYPPHEDTAYDFTIFPGSYKPKYYLQGFLSSGERAFPVDLAPPPRPDGNTYYLLRGYRPNSHSPQRIGMAHKLSLYLDASSTLSFDYWLGFTRSPARIRIELAAADTQRYQAVVAQPQRDKWQHLGLPLSRFHARNRPPRPGLQVQAITIIAEYEEGNPTQVFFFGIDNVRLTGQRLAGFRILSPTVRNFKHWPMQFAPKPFYPGEVLSLQVAPEKNRLKSVTASLKHFDGKWLFRKKPLQKKGDFWQHPQLYHFSAADSPGPLLLILHGLTRDGRKLETTVRLYLLAPPKNRRHPRFFSGVLAPPALKKRLQSPRGQEIWKALVSRAREARKAPVPKTGNLDAFPKDFLIEQIRSYFNMLRKNAENALLNALVYRISGDSEAGAYARSALRRMAGWKQWVHPWFQAQGRRTYYPVGIAAMELAMAYDLIHSLLTEKERRIIRRGILKNGIRNAFQEYFVQNRIPNHTSNWISHVTAGALVALGIFHREWQSPELAAEADLYFSGLMEKFLHHIRATLKKDGGYGEGFGYQNFTMSTAWPLLHLLATQMGIDLVRPLYFSRSHLFPLYISAPDGKHLLDMGDSSDKLRPLSNWAWLALTSTNPTLKWFYWRNRGDNWKDLLWAGLPSVSNSSLDSLPPIRVFPEKGNFVFRTGWRNNEDMVLVFRAGPNFNHTHADQGNFLLWAFGELLVSEAGKAHYYSDPYYWSYFIQSAGHNVVLIDGNPESQEFGDFDNEVVAFRNHAMMTDSFLSPSFSMVSSELAPVYRGLLHRFQRDLYIIQPGYVFVHDRITSSGDQHTYQWQYIPPTRNGLSLNPSEARYDGQKAWLQIVPTSPDTVQFSIVETPIPITEYGDYPDLPLRRRAALRLDSPGRHSKMEFGVLLIPHKQTDAPFRVRTERIGEVRFTQIQAGGFTDEIFTAPPSPWKYKGLRTDAPFLWIRKQNNRMQRWFLQQGKQFQWNQRLWFRADHPVTAVWQQTADGGHWRIQASAPTTVRLAVAVKARYRWGPRVTLIQKNSNFLTLRFQRGNHDVWIF